MLDGQAERMLRELTDRQEILDCVYRYCRGIDRFDVELVASAYHPDAIDEHGMFTGAGRQLAEWANEVHRERWSNHQHVVTNHLVEIDGDVAHAETYFLAFQRRYDGDAVEAGGGRYIDRFERRQGEWRIASRRVMREWEATLPGRDEAHRLPLTFGPRDNTDPVYHQGSTRPDV